MVLNLVTKRREDTAEPTKAVTAPASTPPADPPTEEPRRRTRRTTAAAAPTTGAEAAPAAPAAPARTRTRKTAAEKLAETEAAARAGQPDDSGTPAPQAVALPEPPAPTAVGVETEPLAEGDHESSRGGRTRSRSRGGRGRGRGSRAERAEDRPADGEPSTASDLEPAPVLDASAFREDGSRPELRPILRALEQQSRQVERLARVTEDLARRADRPGTPGVNGAQAPARVARVGVFVDTANVELATDRLRVRFDWTKVLRLLLKDRQLVRAVAYSPIHDDPAVSIETQRFVEPFLDRGFKIVTKPFRRFQDGSIKANLDIELALDVVAMLDRLDVLVLVSGDGDFQRLVELAQSRGVRVEVAAVGASTASNLRHAADEFVDLGSRARDLRH
jgi:uncharacterized LabA/DUF88 family protein